jgi:hypothetical protein
VSLFSMGTGGAGVTTFNFEAVGRTIFVGIPVGDYQRPMGRAIVGSAGRGSGRWRKAKTGNGGVGVGKCFCKLFVSCDKLCHRVILLEGGICKVVEQSGHHGGLLRFGHSLVGEGTVIHRHVMNVSSFWKRQPSNGSSNCSKSDPLGGDVSTRATQVPCRRS